MHELLAMNRIKRSGLTILRSSLRTSSNADVGFAGFSSLATERSVTTGDFFKRALQCRDRHALIHQSPFQLATSTGQNMRSSCFIRCYASNAIESNRKEGSETQKDTYHDDKGSASDYTDLMLAGLVGLTGLAVASVVALWAFTIYDEYESRKRTWMKDDTEQIVVNFHVHGLDRDGLAMSVKFKDKEAKQVDVQVLNRRI